ncbi:MAG: DnaA regulatory inactivator Hda [Gammaproteobacteria bacterium]
MTTQARQLPLDLSAPDRVDLDLYVPGPNAEAWQQLQQWLAGEPVDCLYLWGATGVGKSHLLQATCHELARQELRTAYLPLTELAAHGPQILEGLAEFELVALDDVHTIAGQPEWEQALFHFYNQARDQACNLLLSASASPAGLGLALADLTSRLGWGLVLRLQPLDDAGKQQALVRRAAARGFELPPETAEYLLRHAVRDLTQLMQLLDQLDQAQLAAQRRLSIPFVKSLLGQQK